jgi:hypothetical protein
MRPEELAMLAKGMDLTQARPRKNWIGRAPAGLAFCFRTIMDGSVGPPAAEALSRLGVVARNTRKILTQLRIAQLETELQWAHLKIQVLEERLRQQRIRGSRSFFSSAKAEEHGRKIGEVPG